MSLSETPSSREVPNLKTQNLQNRYRDKRRAGRFLSLKLGASLALGVWNLEFFHGSQLLKNRDAWQVEVGSFHLTPGWGLQDCGPWPMNRCQAGVLLPSTKPRWRTCPAKPTIGIANQAWSATRI